MKSTAVGRFKSVKMFVEYKETEFRNKLINEGLDELLIPDYGKCCYVFKVDSKIIVSKDIALKTMNLMRNGANVEKMEILELFDTKSCAKEFSEYREQF